MRGGGFLGSTGSVPFYRLSFCSASQSYQLTVRDFYFSFFFRSVHQSISQLCLSGCELILNLSIKCVLSGAECGLQPWRGYCRPGRGDSHFLRGAERVLGPDHVSGKPGSRLPLPGEHRSWEGELCCFFVWTVERGLRAWSFPVPAASQKERKRRKGLSSSKITQTFLMDVGRGIGEVLPIGASTLTSHPLNMGRKLWLVPQCSGSGMFIPDPYFSSRIQGQKGTGSWIRNREFKFF